VTEFSYNVLNTAVIFYCIYLVIKTITCETLATDETEKHQLINRNNKSTPKVKSFPCVSANWLNRLVV
jgi:hypothetical protein